MIYSTSDTVLYHSGRTFQKKIGTWYGILVWCGSVFEAVALCQANPFPLFSPEEFNDKILCPELSDSELQRLHGEVQHIYETYCLEESIDKIRFDPFIVEEIKNSKAKCKVHIILPPETFSPSVG